MPSITAIPSTRISDALARQRLLSQVQFDQAELFRIQQQISTGKRFALPSEDAPAALRSVSLEKLLERKEQVKSNLLTNETFLGASDTTISAVAGLLAEARGVALTAANVTSSPEARLAAAEQIDRTIQQLVDTGNQRFRGRYLFAGSQTTLQPFETRNSFVVYHGNQRNLLSYSDIDLAFETNVTGDAIFGAISAAVQGTADLDPILTDTTRLSDLRGGLGISSGSIAVSNGTDTQIINLSGAETIGDVARLLESQPPAGSNVTAFVTERGLYVQLDAGNLTIREVAGGTTARELGILTETGVGTAPVVGQDLHPALHLTTPLADILGVRAVARVTSASPQSTFAVEATRRGPAYNGYTINLVGGGAVGAETVTYDPLLKTITVQVELGLSTAQNVIDAINASPAAADFRALRVNGSSAAGVVDAGSFVTERGGGIEFDQRSGLRIVNGGQTHDISFESADTIEDLLNILNGSDAGVLAQINAARTGIDIRSRISGADFAIGENGGTTAAELGVRTFTEATRLADLNYGRGVHTGEGADVIIRRKDGVELPIDLDLGAQAAARLNPPGANNALVVRAVQPGTQANSYFLQIVDNGGGPATVAFGANTLTFSADLTAGFTAQQALDLLSGSSLAGQFAAQLDLDAEPGSTGNGNLAATGPVAFSGGTPPPQTIGDVLYLINQHPLNVAAGEKVIARLATFGNGIELVHDHLAGAQTLAVLSTGTSQAGEDLGLLGFQAGESGPPVAGAPATVTIDGPGPHDAILFRTKVLGAGGNNYQVEIQDSGAGGSTSVALVGSTLRFRADIAAGFTAQQAIGLLTADPILSAIFEAQLDTSADPGNLGTGNLQATAPQAFSGGLAETLTGKDSNPQETLGVFTALVRLRQALQANDPQAIERSVEVLDAAVQNLNFARAELGARQQALDVLSQRLDTEEVELRRTLSIESEVDLVEAISNLTARQAAFEASLRSLAQTIQLTLLNFL
jgi:flagellin-like hook-associated protein FlgL